MSHAVAALNMPMARTNTRAIGSIRDHRRVVCRIWHMALSSNRGHRRRRTDCSRGKWLGSGLSEKCVVLEEQQMTGRDRARLVARGSCRSGQPGDAVHLLGTMTVRAGVLIIQVDEFPQHPAEPGPEAARNLRRFRAGHSLESLDHSHCSRQCIGERLLALDPRNRSQIAKVSPPGSGTSRAPAPVGFTRFSHRRLLGSAVGAYEAEGGAGR
jgi:hypothetical protein